MEGHECAALIFLRELLSGIEKEIEDRDVRLQKYVAGDRLLY